MDQPKLERLLRLMKLLTANTTYNVDQLAERLQMSRRTVYRYIDTFREAGFVIKKSGDCIRLDKESPHFRDISQLVHFTEEEAVILKNAIENIDDTNMLKQNLKRKLYSVYDNKTLADTVVRGKNAPNIRRLIEAIEQELEAAEHENAGEAEPEKDFGFLAVCAGEGLANVFTDLGADGVISGGQTMNPSTESILKEIKKVPAHTVFVLPNNKNIIMAAQQCIGLTEKTVVVIPTASIPQGVSAMMAVDPDMSDADTIAKAMTDAAQCVSTAQITYAARNSDFDGFDIHEGDYLALLDGKLLGTDRDVSALLDGLSDEAASREAEFITVFYGEDVNEEDAHKACDAFTRKCPDAEVNLICGGQPVYYYIISIE
mgnify:CR=1 FL=1